MAAPLALRGTDGVWMTYGPPKLGSSPPFQGAKSSICRTMTFSEDGSLFAWCNMESIFIVETATDRLVHQISHNKVIYLRFSPRGSVLAVWKNYTVDPNTKQGQPNLTVYDMKTGQCLKELNQKKQTNWCPQWSKDEGISARNVNNELQFFENNDYDTIKNKLHLQKVSEYELAPSGPPYILSAYVPGAKGQPSFVRIYQYPNFGGPTAALANKSFFKADRISMVWNKTGSAVLILTSTESSDSSYYGEQGLHYMSIKGESCLVPLSKKGPIYNIEWNPDHRVQEFCVVHGYMPSKVTLYNMKCEELFHFGTGSRNLSYYNAHGNILCLAGFGNLSGNLEFWDLKQKKLICHTKAPDTTYFQWCPDGEHFVTATTSPRLRVGNCYKFWHYTGTLLAHEPMSDNKELYEVCWQPAPPGVYPEKPVRYKAVGSSLQEQPPAKVAAYRPPCARGEAPSFKVDEFEAPSNAKPDGGQDKPSAQALKNKKKREAKRAKAAQKKLEDPDDADVDAEPEVGGQQAQAVTGSQEMTGASQTAGADDIQKEIKRIRTKLKQIEKLKEQQREGKQLQNQQIEKMKTEESLLSELKSLTIR